MMNRSKRIFLGAGISLFFSCLQILLSLWRTRVIILNIGTEINSINAVSSQLFGYVGLLEGGIGAGFLYKMYAPMASSDLLEINKLYNGLRYSMRKVSLLMLLIMFIASLIYPLLMASNSIGYTRTVLLLILISVRYIVPYFFSVHNKQLLILTERQYILNTIDGVINILILVMEIVLVNYFHVPFEGVLVMGIVFSVATAVLYRLAVLKSLRQLVSQTREKSLEGTKMTKDILVHKLCYIANTQIDAFILSFLDLFKTTVYTSYNSIVGYPHSIMSKVMTNLRGTIGLKLNSKDVSEEENYSLFKEMLALNITVACIICSTFIVMINQFVTLWLGEEYVLDFACCVLFALNLFQGLLNDIIIMMRDGKGLYKESKGYTLATAVCNLVLSLILVHFLGIKGLLLATVISTYLIMDIGNNFLIFKCIFHRKMTIYLDYLLAAITMIISVALGKLLKLMAFQYDLNYSWWNFALEAIVTIIISTIVTFVLQSIFNPYFRKLLSRFRRMLIHKTM